MWLLAMVYIYIYIYIYINYRFNSVESNYRDSSVGCKMFLIKTIIKGGVHHVCALMIQYLVQLGVTAFKVTGSFKDILVPHCPDENGSAVNEDTL